MIFKCIKDLKVLKIFLLLAPVFLLSNLAFGQADDEDENIEEVVVTGYKASLKTATDVKKNSDRIVDSIVALDVGKLPDSNVAEALQRVTGIQIDRERSPTLHYLIPTITTFTLCTSTLDPEICE